MVDWSRDGSTLSNVHDVDLPRKFHHDSNV